MNMERVEHKLLLVPPFGPMTEIWFRGLRGHRHQSVGLRDAGLFLFLI
jgi:hypothetical protein